MIRLNVGGIHYCTTKETLKGPFFDRMFDESMKPGLTDADGRVFIDRNGQLFAHVLDYMRNLDRYVPSESVDLAGLLNEATYFQLDSLVELVRTCLGCDLPRRAFEMRFANDGGPGKCSTTNIFFNVSKAPRWLISYVENYLPPNRELSEGLIAEKFRHAYFLETFSNEAESHGFRYVSSRAGRSELNELICLFSFEPALYIRSLAMKL